jgi:DnaJ-class molecular chaperone
MPRAEDLEISVECTLNELYNGAMKEVSYKRTRIQYDGQVVQTEDLESLNIEIKSGYSTATRLVFPGKGHEADGAFPSDLIITLKESANSNFRREGNDLIYVHKLSLIDALEPKPFHICTLDSRTLALTPPQVVTPQSTIVLAGEGMPNAQSGDVFIDAKAGLHAVCNQAKGNLRIEFDIEFPERIISQH